MTKTVKDEYRQLVAEFKQSGTKYGYLGNVVDIPYFARCHETRMLQLADFVANATFRSYEKKDSGDLDQIYDKFDRPSKDGRHVGLKHFTKDESCSCKACSERESPTKLGNLASKLPQK